MFKNKLKDMLKIIVAVILLSAGLAYAGPWTGPTQTFPNGNADAPINVGSSNQTKLGAIGATNFITAKASVNNDGSASFAVGKITIGSDGALSIKNSSNVQTARIGPAGVGTFSSLKVTGGSPVAGQVLGAKDGEGNLEWKNISSPTTSSGVSKIIAGTNVTISPTSGVGNVTINSNASSPSPSVVRYENLKHGSQKDIGNHTFCALSVARSIEYETRIAYGFSCEVYKSGSSWILKNETTAGAQEGVMCAAYCMDF
ncbi:MAG: hypothetical protein WC757_00600 [Candidatus Paceibacterota bacterium]|jgi:hypothetical protein